MTHTNYEIRENELLRRQLGEAECFYGRLDRLITEITDYCNEQNLKADFTACSILSIIDKHTQEWRRNDDSI